MSKTIDLTGQKFGRLLVVKQAGKDRWGHSKWLCECDCTKKTTVSGKHLRNNKKLWMF